MQEQIAIAYTLGASRFMVLLTQMGANGWLGDRSEDFSSILMYGAAVAIGEDPATMHIIPVDIGGDNSTNVFTSSWIPTWFDGGFQGGSLLDVIDTLSTPEDPSAGPLRWQVDGIYKIKGVGDALTGAILQGKLRTGSKFNPHFPRQ